MRINSLLKKVWLVPIICLSSACMSKPINYPARLTTSDAATVKRVMATLTQATGSQRIVLGPENLATTTTISVLPPPLGQYETRSPAMPEFYDIVKREGGCYLVQRTTGASYALNGVACTTVVAR